MDKDLITKQIIKIVCEEYQIDEKNLKRRTRERDITIIRFAVFYFLRGIIPWTKMANIFSLSHPSAMHGYNRYKDDIAINYNGAKAKAERIKERITNEVKLTL